MPSFVLLVVVVTFAFGVAYVATYLLTRAIGRLQILDHPNERSLHRTPVPRTGGLAIWFGAISATVVALVLLGGRAELVWVSAAALLVGVVSFIDDRRNVNAWARLTAHLFAGGLLLLGDLGFGSNHLLFHDVELPIVARALLTMLFVVWMINLYNFMDGMDGFSGGMSVFGFGSLGLLGYLAGDGYFAAICWIVGAAAGGFLILNFPPARIFMGDTGASALGLMAAALSLWGERNGLFPLWAPVLVFSPFIVDATVTLFRRLIQRERFWEAHRTHYYQRLVRCGWGHRKTVLFEYALMALCAVTAVLGAHAPKYVQWTIIVFWFAVYSVLIVALERQDKESLLLKGKLTQ